MSGPAGGRKVGTGVGKGVAGAFRSGKGSPHEARRAREVDTPPHTCWPGRAHEGVICSYSSKNSRF